MEFYQHDSAVLFRFQLRGRLEGPSVEELEHAWFTACSVMEGKDLEVDISSLTAADAAGIDLLSRMRTSGASLTTPDGLAQGELGWLLSSSESDSSVETSRVENVWSIFDLFRPSRWYRPLRDP